MNDLLGGTRLAAANDMKNDTNYQTNDTNAKRDCSRVWGFATDEVVASTDSNCKNEWNCKSRRKNQAEEIECI